MNPRPAPVVRLEGPLALGHGCLSSLHLAVADRCTRRRCTRTNATAVGKLWSRSLTGAVPRNPVAAVSPTFGRLFEGTDVTSPGQTALSCPADDAQIYCCHNRHAGTPATDNPLRCNVAERLAAARKAVSFCQSRFASKRHRKDKARWLGRQAVQTTLIDRIARRPDTFHRYAARRGRLSCPHLWITMWTVCRRLVCFLPDLGPGGSVVDR